VTMTVILTRDVEDRYRGFLSSCMLEVAPGCYVSPGMSAGVRDRVWTVMSGWHGALRKGSIVQLWPNRLAVGGLGMLVLGIPSKEIFDFDGIFLARRALEEDKLSEPPKVAV
jgi:CRISPR-associated protein Cas2